MQIMTTKETREKKRNLGSLQTENPALVARKSKKLKKFN
jgi:hypothetical protein